MLVKELEIVTRKQQLQDQQLKDQQLKDQQLKDQQLKDQQLKDQLIAKITTDIVDGMLEAAIVGQTPM